MIAPHYVGENKSDLRGIKPGWYAMNSNGNLVSGPFSSQEKCAEKIASGSTGFSAVTKPPIRKL
jgi:hypothetical protein